MSTTSSNLNLEPGSGFGFGTDKLNRKKDKLLQKRKKELDKKTIKQLTGEQAMSTVATFTSNSRESISLQYNILDMHNKTTSDMWTLSKIETNGGSHSFTVTSVQPDHYLTQENLERNVVAGVSVAVAKHENEVDPSEAIAESMINSITNGLDAEDVAEAYLNVESVEISEVKESTESMTAVESIQKNILAMAGMSSTLDLSESAAKDVSDLLGEALEIMTGKKKED